MTGVEEQGLAAAALAELTRQHIEAAQAAAAAAEAARQQAAAMQAAR